MRVKDVMRRDIRTIAPDRPLTEAGEVMKRFGIEHLIVLERGQPIGLLAEIDVLRHPGDGDVASAVTRRVVTIDQEELVRRAANLMRGHGIKSLVVMNKDKVAGIVTSSDVLEVVSRTGHKERMTLRDRGPKRTSRQKQSPPPARH